MGGTLLVTGANGAVGSYVEQVFGSQYDLVLTDKHNLDVTSQADCARAINACSPDIVLHLAAATNVDECETHPHLAWNTNALGTSNIVRAAQASKLVYVSTAGVFRGDKQTPYVETDRPAPVNRYGWSKLRGEWFVDNHHPEWLTVRSGWMFGGGENLDRKFVGKIQEQIAAGATTVLAVDDKFGSPTYAHDLLTAIGRLLAADQQGVFHAANDGAVSRFDVACAIVDELGVDVAVEAVSSSKFPLPAPRAVSEAMQSERMIEVGVEPSRPWREALTAYLT